MERLCAMNVACCVDGAVGIGGFVRCSLRAVRVCMGRCRCVENAAGDGMQCIGKLCGVNDRP